MTLKEHFEKAVAAYIVAFELKHETSLEFWVADNIGGYAIFGDHGFCFDDIRHDIDTDQPAGQIFEYSAAHMDALMELSNETINYKSWCMGARYKR
jgi:hypothetical protein